jgi:pyruvate,water dikinase
MAKTVPKNKKNVLWFDELGREEVALVGGKSASLGEMTSKTKVPVPFGFATTASAYRLFMEEAGIEDEIRSVLDELEDPEDTRTLHKIGAKIRKAIVAASMPDKLQEEITEAYEKLTQRYQEESGRDDLPFVAIRSSATAEDLPDASFAGQQETYLNVRGAEEVVERVKECYSSLFTNRAIYYRIQKGFDHMDVALSAVVQLMVFSESAGVMFTLNVSTGDRDVVLIEAGWGLGEYVVQGTVTPDEYLVSKKDFEIVKKSVSKKTQMLIRNPGGGVEEKEVPKEKQEAQILSDEQIVELAKYAVGIEDHYGMPMDIEWGLDERTDKLWILQARPETVWSQKEVPEKEEEVEFTTERNVICKGMPASPGLAAGTAHVIMSVEGIHDFNKGEVLVTEMTAPDWVPAMKKAKAIVTNSGGMTCHAAIVSRELGIPCIVGTGSRGDKATDAIKDGAEVTVDAKNGIVYEGILEEAVKKKETKAAAVATEAIPVTGTKVYMNLGIEFQEKHGALPADGIGLMREEFIWTEYIHDHPLQLIEEGTPEKVVDQLAEFIRKTCAGMSPRPVVLRFSDFKTSEYRNLRGGDKFEPEEPSALLGWRGASRYYDPKYRDAFRLELQAVKKVREEFGLKNLWVMIPFCRTVEEARKVISIMADEGLERGPDFQVWLMAEIPSNVILADQFNQFIDGYSIGSNDLTMTLLGADRDNETIGRIFDERNLAIKRSISHLIEVAHKDGKTVSICGQAPSVYPEFVEFLVRSGIDSVSVNPDAVKSVKKRIASIEQRVMMEKLTGKGKAPKEDYSW